MTPSLEAQLKNHRIWSFTEVWLGLSRDLEITTMLGIHFLQDQMASYEIEPDLLEKVTLKLVDQMRSKMDPAQLDAKAAAMSTDAEEGCRARIQQYRQIYTKRQEEKEQERLRHQDEEQKY